jgi:tetratricopeptide (TPR) repeat protein
VVDPGRRRNRRFSGWQSIGFFCFAIGTLQAAQNNADTAIEHEFQAAVAAQDRGELDKAESMLLALRSKHPGLFAVDESLGLLYVGREQFAAALPILKAAATESPSSDLAHANLGADYLKLGKNEEAVRELRIAARLNPANGETQSNLGQAFVASNQPAEAAKALGKAVALEPENWDLRYNWAAVLLDTGDTDQAAQALAPIPNQDAMPQVQALLGDIAEKQGRFLDAVKHLQAAAKLDPSEANIYFLGLEYLKHWTFDPAIQFFEYGVAHYPSSKRMLLGLGITRYSMNQVPAAASIFARLLDADPENATYADLLGMSCTLFPDSIKECETLERYAETNQKNAAIDTYAATSILARSGETAKIPLAASLLDKAIAIDPKLAEAHYQKGLLLQFQEEWRESIPELESSIALKPESSRPHYRLALAYAHTGNREKANEQFTLQKKYREQEKEGIDARFSEVQMFVVAAK